MHHTQWCLCSVKRKIPSSTLAILLRFWTRTNWQNCKKKFHSKNDDQKTKTKKKRACGGGFGGITSNFTTSVLWLSDVLKNDAQLNMYSHCRSPISLGYGRQKCWNWRAGRPHQRQPHSAQRYKRRSNKIYWETKLSGQDWIMCRSNFSQSILMN